MYRAGNYIYTSQDMPDIEHQEEYTQSDPQILLVPKDYNLDRVSLKNILDRCGRHGMWIFITLKDIGNYDVQLNFWLNVREKNDNILSGYIVDRSSSGNKIKRDIDIKLSDIKNIQCYDPTIDTNDNENDLFIKYNIIDICKEGKGVFLGKDYLDIGEGFFVYYEIYECGVNTGIYFNYELISEFYIPRYHSTIEHRSDYYVSPTISYIINISISKNDNELQQRLYIILNERVLDDIYNVSSYMIKLPWS